MQFHVPFFGNPRGSKRKARKRILRNLNPTKGYDLQFKLMALCAANWAEDRKTGQGVSDFICFYAGNAIAWYCRKQICVALSQMKAEYI